MSLEVVGIAWIACALFFGIGHAVMAIAISRIPLRDVDLAIQYLEWLMEPFNWLMSVSFVSLMTAVIALWAYSIVERSVEAWIVSLVVSVLGVFCYIASKKLLKLAMFSHLRDAGVARPESGEVPE